jgi:hypothetical protein
LQTSELEAFERLLAESPGLYKITQLKQEPRNFSLKETKYEMQRGEQLYLFYTTAEDGAQASLKTYYQRWRSPMRVLNIMLR